MTLPAPTDVRPTTYTGRPPPWSQTTDSAAARAAWTRSRYQALLAVVGQPRLAVALLANAALETGWGRAEKNYALGNVRWTGSGPAFLQQGGDDRVPRPYRAYDSLEQGVRAYVDKATTGRYAAGWQRLLNGGSEVEWYSYLMVPADGVDGWHPYSDGSLDTYASVLRRARATLGLMAPPDGPLPYYRPGTRPPGAVVAQQPPPPPPPRTGVSSATLVAVIVVSAVAVAGAVVYRRRKR